MIDHLKSPFFGPDTIRDALEKMRKGQSIQRSPLLNLVWIRTLDHWGAFSEVAIDVVLRDALTEIVEAQLNAHRAYEELSAPTPQTRGEVIDQLRADFQTQNAELEAWSAVLHRYIRLEFGLQVQSLAEAAHVTARQVRRRLKHGFFRLAEEVTSLEREARNKNQRLALSVKLPPPTYSELYGRSDLCDEIAKAILHGGVPRMTVLSGLGGMGKSSVAHRVVSQLIEADHFEDLIWLTLDQPLDFGGLLNEIASALHYVAVFDTGEHGLERNIGVRLRQIRTLLVVDAIDYLSDWSGRLAQLGFLVGDGHLLATSRHAPDSEAPVHVVPVEALDRDPFQRLLHQVFRHQRLALPSQDVIEDIFQITAGNPLAGKLIVRQMKILPLDAIITDLGDQPTFDNDRLFDYLFARIWGNLSKAAQKVAIGMILLPDVDITYDDLARFLAFGADDLQKTLVQLDEASFVMVVGRPPRYRMSALTRQFIWREVGKEAHLPDLMAMLAALRAHDDLDSTLVPVRMDRLLAAVGSHSLSTLARADMQTLIDQTGHMLRLVGQWRRWQAVLERIEAMISGAEGEWASILPMVWTELGVAHRQQGHVREAEAYAHQAISAFGEVGEFQKQGRALLELGRAYEMRSMPQPALEAYRRSAATGERYQDHELWQRAVNRLAHQVLEQDQPEEALRYLAQRDDRVAGDSDEENPETLLLWGRAHLATGDFAEATNLLEAAHQGYIEDGNVAMVARTHFQIALAAYQVGESERFLVHLRQGFGLMYALGDFIGLSRLITLMGIVRLEEGMAERALVIWEAAQELQSLMGDTRGQAFTLFHLADLYWKMNRLDEARQALEEARLLAEDQPIEGLIGEIAAHPLHESGGGGYNGEQ